MLSSNLVPIPLSEDGFQMGDPAWELYEPGAVTHRVYLRRGYVLGATAVTQREYAAIVGSNPSFQVGDDHPVEQVSWLDAVAYCDLRSDREGLPRCYRREGDGWICDFAATGYRLPTEAEWEHAARGGEAFAFAGSSAPDTVAWYKRLGGRPKTHPVAKRRPNGFGLYDMSGNVAEWCWDLHGPYPAIAATDPTGPAAPLTSLPERLIRGGSAADAVQFTRVFVRAHLPAAAAGRYVGFRLARTLQPFALP